MRAVRIPFSAPWCSQLQNEGLAEMMLKAFPIYKCLYSTVPELGWEEQAGKHLEPQEMRALILITSPCELGKSTFLLWVLVSPGVK